MGGSELGYSLQHNLPQFCTSREQRKKRQLLVCLPAFFLFFVPASLTWRAGATTYATTSPVPLLSCNNFLNRPPACVPVHSQAFYTSDCMISLNFQL